MEKGSAYIGWAPSRDRARSLSPRLGPAWLDQVLDLRRHSAANPAPGSGLEEASPIDLAAWPSFRVGAGRALLTYDHLRAAPGDPVQQPGLSEKRVPGRARAGPRG